MTTHTKSHARALYYFSSSSDDDLYDSLSSSDDETQEAPKRRRTPSLPPGCHDLYKHISIGASRSDEELFHLGSDSDEEDHLHSLHRNPHRHDYYTKPTSDYTKTLCKADKRKHKDMLTSISAPLVGPSRPKIDLELIASKAQKQKDKENRKLLKLLTAALHAEDVRGCIAARHSQHRTKSSLNNTTRLLAADRGEERDKIREKLAEVGRLHADNIRRLEEEAHQQQQQEAKQVVQEQMRGQLPDHKSWTNSSVEIGPQSSPHSGNSKAALRPLYKVPGTSKTSGNMKKETVECSECGKSFPARAKSSIRQHNEMGCPKRWLHCFCGERVRACEMRKHKKTECKSDWAKREKHQRSREKSLEQKQQEWLIQSVAEKLKTEVDQEMNKAKTNAKTKKDINGILGSQAARNLHTPSKGVNMTRKSTQRRGTRKHGTRTQKPGVELRTHEENFVF